MIVETSRRRRSWFFSEAAMGTTRLPLAERWSVPWILPRAMSSGGVAQLFAAVERSKEGDAHQHARGIPVRKVPVSQRVDTSRRSGGRRPPPASSAGSSPGSVACRSLKSHDGPSINPCTWRPVPFPTAHSSLYLDGAFRRPTRGRTRAGPGDPCARLFTKSIATRPNVHALPRAEDKGRRQRCFRPKLNRW